MGEPLGGRGGGAPWDAAPVAAADFDFDFEDDADDAVRAEAGFSGGLSGFFGGLAPLDAGMAGLALGGAPAPDVAAGGDEDPLAALEAAIADDLPRCALGGLI
jgi:hypothetical protein